MRIVGSKIRSLTLVVISFAALIYAVNLASAHPADSLSPAEARAIAKEAYIYGYPMVDGYRILYAYFVDPNNAEYKAPWNHIRNIPRVFTPEDRAVQTPNSDTPYSMLGWTCERSRW